MPDEDLRYDHMVEEALRGVVGRALRYAARHGLPGGHHFYITFRTDDPQAQVPARLRERYPSEMTIVLQYQFWDLEVTDEGFSVTLSFGDVPETLAVPYRAVVAFADPSVRFGLQFDVASGDKAAGPLEDREGQAPAESVPEQDDTATGTATDTATDTATRAENVVPLDTFRKKST